MEIIYKNNEETEGRGLVWIDKAPNGKEATVNRALDGSTYPG